MTRRRRPQLPLNDMRHVVPQTGTAQKNGDGLRQPRPPVFPRSSSGARPLGVASAAPCLAVVTSFGRKTTKSRARRSRRVANWTRRRLTNMSLARLLRARG
jgi:hypothetical protein